MEEERERVRVFEMRVVASESGGFFQARGDDFSLAVLVRGGGGARGDGDQRHDHGGDGEGSDPKMPVEFESTGDS